MIVPSAAIDEPVTAAVPSFKAHVASAAFAVAFTLTPDSTGTVKRDGETGRS